MTKNNDLAHEIYSEDDVDLIEVPKDDSLKVQTMEDATRFSYGLAKTREEIEELEEIASKEIAKWEKRIEEVKEWLKSSKEPLESRAEYLENQLRMFHIHSYENAKNDSQRKKVTSIKLPYNVTLKSRSQQPKFEVVDEESYNKYAEDNDYLKPPKPRDVDWAKLKKNLSVTDKGEVIDKDSGEKMDKIIKAIPQERKFEVK